MARFDSAQRAKILAAAIPVFAAKGLEGASIRNVSQAARVNSALIYYYFENKSTLFSEAVRLVIGGLIDRLKSHQPAFAGARERLGYLVNGVFDYYEAHPERLQLMSVAISLHAGLIGRVINGILKERAWLPLQIIQEGIRKGELRPMHPALVWWSILALSIFCLHVRDALVHVESGLIPQPLPEMTKARQPIIDLLARGLAKKDR